MRRAYSVLIAGVILIVVGIGLILPSVYNASSLLKSVSVNDLTNVLVTRFANSTQEQPLPKDSSLYDLVKTGLKNLVIKGFKYVLSNENQSSSQEQELSLKKLAFGLGLYSLIILIGIILIVNGIISLVAGTIIFVYDRRKMHHLTKK